MPLRYRAFGREIEIHYSHDLLADPACRGVGLGKKLVRAVADAAPSVAGGLWMTGACYALHQRVGWKPVKPFRTQRLVLRATEALRRRIGSPWLAGLIGPPISAWLWLGRRRLPQATLPVTEISRFDDGIDRLFERVAGSFGVIAERKQSYLNWKYADSPNVMYRRLLIGDPGEPDGYVVTRADRRGRRFVGGLIVDFLADPARPEVFESCIAAAVKGLREEGAAVVDVLTTHPPFREILRRAGFVSARLEQTFVITGHEEDFPGEDLLDNSKWYLTLGESDGDMWSSAQSWRIDRQAETSEQIPTPPS
jgi:hypothetical protein